MVLNDSDILREIYSKPIPDWKQYVKPEYLIDLVIVPDGSEFQLTKSTESNTSEVKSNE